MNLKTLVAWSCFLVGALVGGVGIGIDALTDAMWHLEPAKVERKLVPQ